MRQKRQWGLSMIELLIGLLIGSIAVIVINQVLAVFEGQKRTSTSGSDAQVNGAVALFSLEREIRMAGYGMVANGASLCPLGINIYYNGTVISNGGALAPVSIIDGGVGPDSLAVIRSDSDFAAIPTSIIKSMPTPSSELTADSTGGLNQCQALIAAGKNGSKVCTLMQMSQDPQQTGNGWNLQHNSGGKFLYNPPNPAMVFTNAPQYEIGDVVVNMGSFRLRQYQITNEQLLEIIPLGDASSCVAGAANTAPILTPLVNQVVSMQAQYGIVAAGSTTINEWRNATGAWAAPTAADVLRIRAVRIALVARSLQYEKELVSPATLTLWPAGDPGDDPPTLSLTDDQRHYRYKVFETIVPIRNAIWGGA